jgi:hypothetical protein
MHTPRLLPLIAAAMVLGAAACADAPTAVQPPAAGATLQAGSGRPVLVPNAVRYRAQGAGPARGRAGSAVLDALALLGLDGTTTLQLSAHDQADEGRAGAVTRLQVKGFDINGKHKFTRNRVPSTGTPALPGTLELQGLGWREQVQLQAHVRGLDASRTDVVTVTETVKRAPDLRVRVSAPDSAPAGSQVNVVATVGEHNGDVGSRADCELHVAGQRVDVAPGIWVDAGDAVSCVFTWRFTEPGTYPLEVRVIPTGPEWNATDNTDTATVQVTERPSFITWGSFSEYTVDDRVTHDYYRQNTNTGEATLENTTIETFRADQSAWFTGSLPARLSSPVDVRVSMSTGGSTVHQARWQGLEGSGSDWCESRVDGPTMFWLCTGMGWNGVPATDFTYSLVAGTVTYHSTGYSRTWDLWTGAETSFYHWNEYGSSGHTVPVLGDWTFEVHLDSPDGGHVAARTLSTYQPEFWVAHYGECYSWDDPDAGFSESFCTLGVMHGQDLHLY